jgi:hypothetical protein
MNDFYERMSKKELYDKWVYFENSTRKASAEADYYRTELAKAHEILGRVVHQASERWDTLRLTKYYPADNLWSTKYCKSDRED